MATASGIGQNTGERRKNQNRFDYVKRFQEATYRILRPELSRAATSGTGYMSTDVPKAIPDLVTTTSTLAVSGDTASIAKVTVWLDITHTYDGDVDIYLISPTNTIIELSTDNGGWGDNYTNTVFDDNAATSITAGTAPFAGTFRPEAPLSALVGEDANGTWTLSVSDDEVVAQGTLNAWGITVW